MDICASGPQILVTPHLCQPQGVLCDVCSDSAVKTCLDCMASYCETHVRGHYTSPDLQRHELQDLQCENLCVEHHRKLKLYCRNDQSAICWRCLLYDHRTHDVIEQNPGDTSSKSVIIKDVPSPGQMEFSAVKPDSVHLRWSPPGGAPGPHKYKVTWTGGGKQRSVTVEVLSLKVVELLPGEKYRFAVATLGKDNHQSPWVERSVITEVPPPKNVSVTLQSMKAYLIWTKPEGVDQVSYLVQFFRDQKCIDTIHANSPSYTITGLQYGGNYTFSLCTVLGNDRQSKSNSYSFKIEKLRIVLLGKCGAGKSASGNTILWREEAQLSDKSVSTQCGTVLGKEEAQLSDKSVTTQCGTVLGKEEAQLSDKSVTTQCGMARGEVDGRRLCVIDTPGLFHTRLSKDETIREIERCITLSSPGPHVFLIVLPIGRFTSEDHETMKMIQNIFGKESAKYTILLFTNGDRLKEKTVETYLRSSKELSGYVAQCGGRYHVFNNSQPENRSQVTELLQKIDGMVAENGGACYTTEMFQQVKRHL